MLVVSLATHAVGKLVGGRNATGQHLVHGERASIVAGKERVDAQRRERTAGVVLKGKFDVRGRFGVDHQFVVKRNLGGDTADRVQLLSQRVERRGRAIRANQVDVDDVSFGVTLQVKVGVAY